MAYAKALCITARLLEFSQLVLEEDGFIGNLSLTDDKAELMESLRRLVPLSPIADYVAE